jgi:hypothetical protein
MGLMVNILLTRWVFWGAAMWNFRAFAGLKPVLAGEGGV